jgi:Beta-lactamase enzyme family
MINSPLEEEKAISAPEAPQIVEGLISQPSPKSTGFPKNLIMTIGIWTMALLGGYFGWMILHQISTSSSVTSQISTSPPVKVSPIKFPNQSPEPMDSDDAPIFQNSKQPHQITLAFKSGDKNLEQVIHKIIKHCKDSKLSTESLSISLVDLKTNERFGYQNTVSRYPASVVKIFWLLKMYENQTITPEIYAPLNKMIIKSDNNGASEVLDYLTQTKSSKQVLSGQEFKAEKIKRQSINTFYQHQGYSSDINVSQKTFPITKENIMEPQGFDKQLRGQNVQKPIRNKVTTDDAALLISKILSHPNQAMRGLLTRNIDPGFWRKQQPNPIDFNPVESFFGEGLEGLGAENIVSKAGWTSASRQEVAYIKSKNGNTEYILTVFGDSADYAKSKKIFPEIAKLVYQEMQDINNHSQE